MTVDDIGLRVLPAAAAIDLLGWGFGDGTGSPAGHPLIAVHPDDDLARLAHLTRDLPCVLVTVHDGPEPPRLTAPVDVALTSAAHPPRPWVSCPDGTPAALATLAGAVRATPLASVALVQLLRLSAGMRVLDAIVAESFVYSMLQSGPEYARWLAGRRGHAVPSDDTEPVLLSRTGGDLTVTLNRPQVRNAYNVAMREGLIGALQVAAADPGITAIHLTGAGRAFCAGGDLTEFGSSPDPATSHGIRTQRSAARWAVTIAGRLTAHLHGACVGAGIELPAFARRVEAAPDTVIRLPEIAMGLVPGAGGTASITRRIGRERTAWLALTGLPLTVAEALAWGLVDAVGESRPT